jgi:uncharacterized protein
MVERVIQKERPDKTKTGFIDCDIHNIVPSVGALEPYLESRWIHHAETFGMRGHHGFAKGIPYPKVSPGGGSRVDSWPPSGLPPGADLGFMKQQHLDPLPIEYGILNCLYPKVGEQLNEEYGGALARATNDWQVAEWLDKDSRLRASIVVPYENAEFAAEEIERVGDHPGFVQVVLLPRTKEPLGKRRYWKMYEAAERHDLPIGIHFAGLGGNPITSSGWPSYYIEDHTVMSMAFQSQVISLVCEGVFERFPKLRVVLMEGGFAWLPALMWRLDKLWERVGHEVPHLKRRPSEYIRNHMWATTQPMEEPRNPKHLLQVIDHLGSEDMLMFATDYPHWDYDDPDRAFQATVPAELKRKIFSENARALYRF